MPLLKAKDPAVPFTTAIPGGQLEPGSVIKVVGTPIDSASRFRINLKNASHDSNVFHFNPRFDQGQLVRNCNFPSGSWGPEERSDPLPFEPGREFELEIICLLDCFLVTVDGNYCCEFHHRAPINEVDTVEINGDLVLKKIKIHEQDSTYNKLNVNNPEIPFRAPLGTNLSKGQEVHVYGKIPASGRFHVNLQHGGGYPESTLAFHFNPRYESDPVVVMNSWIDSAWGPEERLDCGALKPGDNFALIIRVKSDGYKVIVNGHKFAKYEHRIDPETADTVEIGGNITVHRLLAY